MGWAKEISFACKISPATSIFYPNSILGATRMQKTLPVPCLTGKLSTQANITQTINLWDVGLYKYFFSYQANFNSILICRQKMLRRYLVSVCQATCRGYGCKNWRTGWNWVRRFFLSRSNVPNLGLTFGLFVSYFTVDIFAQHLRMPRKMLAWRQTRHGSSVWFVWCRWEWSQYWCYRRHCVSKLTRQLRNYLFFRIEQNQISVTIKSFR